MYFEKAYNRTVNVKQSYFRNRQWRPIGLGDVKDPILLDN
jgi:hypothetical protein